MSKNTCNKIGQKLTLKIRQIKNNVKKNKKLDFYYYKTKFIIVKINVKKNNKI